MFTSDELFRVQKVAQANSACQRTGFGNHLRLTSIWITCGKNAIQSMKRERDEFSDKTKEILARRAGFRCSICQNPTVGPHSKSARALYLGEACHIHAAAPNGPRPKPSLTTEQRVDVSNGIHLCKSHARLIDVDTVEYTAEKLIEIKSAHERRIRALVVGTPQECDPDFLTSHETQLVHGRGSPTLGDLWVPRYVSHRELGHSPNKRDPVSLLSSESGILLISGDQWSGRTSLLKRMAAAFLEQRNCIWLSGRDLTETSLSDPVGSLASGYQKLYNDPEGWNTFLERSALENLIFLDDLHLSPLNIASKCKLLSLLQAWSHLIVVTATPAFLIELMAAPAKDGLRIMPWSLLDMTRADCAKLVSYWCKFGAARVPDHELDSQIAEVEDRLELLFGRNLMPRRPQFVITALQMIDAGAPLDTAVGSYGGVYETVIHLALARNARSQATISNERVYLEELAYWCETNPESADRHTFNEWFAERKAIPLPRVAELEISLLAKSFLARRHQGFRFNYQKYYFIASFIRSNPTRPGVQEYLRKLVACCWNEDYANTALFLAYLQPSSFLIDAILAEVTSLFPAHPEFDMSSWKIDAHFPKDFFRGLALSNDPEDNRRKLADRLDERSPVDSPECSTSTSSKSPSDEVQSALDFLKAFHLIKLLGQLIRNSPFAFDAQQKQNLLQAGFNLGLRLATFASEICSPQELQNIAVAQLRQRILQKADRVELEAKLSGLIYSLIHFIILAVFRHTCFYLAHPDLALVYQRLFRSGPCDSSSLSYQFLGCGLGFELRAPDTHVLDVVYRKVTSPGQDLLRTWAWFFLSFNRIPVPKRQQILDTLEMSSSVQLLLSNPG